MKHEYSIEYEGVSLRPLEHGDIEQLRLWRNRDDNSRYIRKLAYITSEKQEAWFAEDSKDPSVLTFAVCNEGKLAGSVALYDLGSATASFGRLMIGDAKSCGIGGKATIAVLRIAFESVGLAEVTAEVSVDNTPAIVIYTRVGFCIVGRGYNPDAKMDEFKLSLSRERFNNLMGNQI